MTKDALGWVRGLRSNNLITIWERFTEYLLERFGDSAFEDKLAQLSRLQQVTTVAAYMAQFERLMNEVQGQSEEALIGFFIEGLKSKIQDDMLVRRPVTLRRALAEAKILEARKGGKEFKGGRYVAANKTELIFKTPPAAGGVPIVRRTLTIEERKERSAKGLCFNCDEQYAPGHKCKGKLFLMNMENECLVEMIGPAVEDAEELDGEMEISMYALTGSFNPRTIKLAGTIEGQ